MLSRSLVDRQPIKPRHDDNVSGVDGFQQPVELSTMVCHAADLFLEHFRRARFVQGGLLRGQRLVNGTDARVTVDNHELALSHISYAHNNSA